MYTRYFWKNTVLQTGIASVLSIRTIMQLQRNNYNNDLFPNKNVHVYCMVNKLLLLLLLLNILILPMAHVNIVT